MNLQWNILYTDDSAFPRLLQFGEFNDERFRYGINNQMQRCLYFNFFSDNKNLPIEPAQMANLSLEEVSVSGKPALVLTLLNDNLKDLFSDLILSLVSQTLNADIKVAKSRFITLCNEWFGLFDPIPGDLSKQDLQGIFAELQFLQLLLTRSHLPFNDIVAAWKGPFGKGHDFELGENIFEIKSISEGKPLIHISSEYQLDYLDGQNLYLVVYEYFIQQGEGVSLSSLIQKIVAVLRSQIGTNMSIFWTALGKTGLTYKNIQHFDSHLFSLKNVLYYVCKSSDFPSIRRSLLPDAIRNVKYEIALGSLSTFQLNDITL